MSPKEARVFVVEDEPEWRRHFGRTLERAGHQVVLTATTLVDALSKVLSLEKKGVQVALVDGNLTTGSWDGTDGCRVVEAIKENAPSVKIVGVSASSDIPGVDVNLRKPRVSEQLGKTVTNL